MYRFGLTTGYLWKSVIGKNTKEIKDFYSQRCFTFLVTNLHTHPSVNLWITPMSTHRHFLNSFLSQTALHHVIWTLEMSFARISRLLCRKTTPFSVPTRNTWHTWSVAFCHHWLFHLLQFQSHYCNNLHLCIMTPVIKLFWGLDEIEVHIVLRKL